MVVSLCEGKILYWVEQPRTTIGFANQAALILWWPVSSVICKYLMCFVNDEPVTQDCPV